METRYSGNLGMLPQIGTGAPATGRRRSTVK
ncbi:hypothetical protein J2X54_004680 [Duganella sp. 3397]|nr:hypothetical protein [Duganella sp. 3397]